MTDLAQVEEQYERCCTSLKMFLTRFQQGPPRDSPNTFAKHWAAQDIENVIDFNMHVETLAFGTASLLELLGLPDREDLQEILAYLRAYDNDITVPDIPIPRLATAYLVLGELAAVIGSVDLKAHFPSGLDLLARDDAVIKVIESALETCCICTLELLVVWHTLDHVLAYLVRDYSVDWLLQASSLVKDDVPAHLLCLFCIARIDIIQTSLLPILEVYLVYLRAQKEFAQSQLGVLTELHSCLVANVQPLLRTLLKHLETPRAYIFKNALCPTKGGEYKDIQWLFFEISVLSGELAQTGLVFGSIRTTPIAALVEAYILEQSQSHLHESLSFKDVITRAWAGVLHVQGMPSIFSFLDSLAVIARHGEQDLEPTVSGLDEVLNDLITIDAGTCAEHLSAFVAGFFEATLSTLFLSISSVTYSEKDLEGLRECYEVASGLCKPGVEGFACLKKAYPSSLCILLKYSHIHENIWEELFKEDTPRAAAFKVLNFVTDELLNVSEVLTKIAPESTSKLQRGLSIMASIWVILGEFPPFTLTTTSPIFLSDTSPSKTTFSTTDGENNSSLSIPTLYASPLTDDLRTRLIDHLKLLFYNQKPEDKGPMNAYSIELDRALARLFGPIQAFAMENLLPALTKSKDLLRFFGESIISMPQLLAILLGTGPQYDLQLTDGHALRLIRTTVKNDFTTPHVLLKSWSDLVLHLESLFRISHCLSKTSELRQALLKRDLQHAYAGFVRLLGDAFQRALTPLADFSAGCYNDLRSKQVPGTVKKEALRQGTLLGLFTSTNSTPTLVAILGTVQSIRGFYDRHPEVFSIGSAAVSNELEESLTRLEEGAIQLSAFSLLARSTDALIPILFGSIPEQDFKDSSTPNPVPFPMEVGYALKEFESDLLQQRLILRFFASLDGWLIEYGVLPLYARTRSVTAVREAIARVTRKATVLDGTEHAFPLCSMTLQLIDKIHEPYLGQEPDKFCTEKIGTNVNGLSKSFLSRLISVTNETLKPEDK
ncbi:hypothetical protein GMRT_12968 [Giardia muris]|uniref:Uncharacterized protein n=1 Tax=Giardia muris TaxID=5742 RepID=A0A4Z1SV10_GIAMU|nr:hypothetical protein GMRT_12968 [Giardia muris]|eukprot:TNJ27428.1 hypothetical protein GMRT_12968 [Giardia muris]